MDSQSQSPNGANAAERSAGVRPENFQTSAEVGARPAAGAEAPAAPEMAPVPGSGPAQDPAAAAAPAAPPPKLSAADVAAAIAAVPGPAGPGAVPAPAVANDVDVIEPEWVNKAEEVVRIHQGDPYGEEEAIEALNQDYLLKRYGHKVANPNVDNTKSEGK